MNEPDENSKRKYQWPWFVLAAVVLGIVLAVIWVCFAVKKIERERNFNPPVSAAAK